MTEEAAFGVDWSALRLAVVGGDARDPEIARLAAATGATVKAYGMPWPAGGVAGVDLETTVAAAVRNADYCCFPIPLGEGYLIYAPHAPEPIVADERLFSLLASGANVFIGRASAEFSAAAKAAGVATHEYDGDRELMLLRGPAIVEGAIELAIKHTDTTIHRAEVAVVGAGNIGSMLARRLIALGAHVHVAARSAIQRAGAIADGAAAVTLEELPALATELSMIFNTVPARVVGREVLERLPRDSLVMDLAPPPEHADLELAEELGHRVVWARGLGRRAPVSVGASQWMGIRRRITEIEDKKVVVS